MDVWDTSPVYSLPDLGITDADIDLLMDTLRRALESDDTAAQQAARSDFVKLLGYTVRRAEIADKAQRLDANRPTEITSLEELQVRIEALAINIHGDDVPELPEPPKQLPTHPTE